VAEPLDERYESGTVTTGLYPHDHFASEGGVETTDIIPLMVQLGEAYLAAGQVAVTNSLLTRVEVDSTIDSHGHLLRGPMHKMSLPQFTREMEVPAS
jgi:hypothetical protein